MSNSSGEPVTLAAIMSWFEENIEAHISIPPWRWVDAGAKLCVLLGGLHDELCEREQDVARLKLAYLQEDPKHNVSAAKARVQASDDYREYRKCEMRCSRIHEFIQLAKSRGRLMDAEKRNF